jgi:N-methylhydantoinase A/oxoprolinase/acetone carboxylase beta subunit
MDFFKYYEKCRSVQKGILTMIQDQHINYGLGIDTGGTNTDATIVDLDTTKVVAKSKARTSHHDLSIGLGEAVDNVYRIFGSTGLEPNLIGVSTTLATNSILEGVGGQVGLIGLGWTPRRGDEYGTKYQFFLEGGHDVRGRPQTSLDHGGIQKAIAEMAPHVDSIVVSSLFSVYNPLHEIEVKRIIREQYDLPVVMGHELTGELGFYERTVTAVLNARLLPVLSDFLRKVQEIMELRGIRAPIMVLKGDGNLMNLRMAKERPVETLLSGPAASARGALLLSGLQNCIAIDIGGTSTDIAVMEDGRCKVSREGAVVGSWPTRVEAVNVRSVGLGGDSEVRLSPKNELIIGPERVIPLCFATTSFPRLVEKMTTLGETRFYRASLRQHGRLTRVEQTIVDYLMANGPQALEELQDALLDVYLLETYVRSLKSKGAIEGIGLTPTDALHAVGRYTQGDQEAAKVGVKVFAFKHQLEESELTKRVIAKVSSRIADEVLKKLLSDEVGSWQETEVLQGLIDGLSGQRSFPNFSLNAHLKYPLVGLGGPAGAFMPPLAERLHVQVVIPEDHDVGNAIGAVCGEVSEFVDVFVCPREHDYAIYSSFSPPICIWGERDAVKRAKELASTWAMERAVKAGGCNLQVEMKLEEERERSKNAEKKDTLVQMWIRARAVGEPVDRRFMEMMSVGPKA